MAPIITHDPRSDFLRAASLGLEVAVAVFLGAFVGYEADRHFQSGPWLMVAGVVVGSLAGLWNAYKLAGKNERA
ncbi:MAG: AtpZ/AtpI family protein [Candidatus Saganbacteria bacterium]|nr:AtpZ/AtpI family protein [Candidatus Saganbacteria bacterium]